MNLSFYKNGICLKELVISIIHVTDTERNITPNIGKAVTRNTEFIGAMVTFKLQTA
jgi:hypothetical protein